MSLLNCLAGSYTGNVQNATMNLGNIKKTGHIKITDNGSYVTISCYSLLKNNLKVTIPKRNLDPYFSTKMETFKLEDGSVEKRVSFIHSVDDSYGFLNRWLGGLTSEMYAFQMKFRNESLYAFRLQNYNTSDKSKIKYLIEISNIEKEQVHEPIKTIKHEKPPAMKTDWDF